MSSPNPSWLLPSRMPRITRTLQVCLLIISLPSVLPAGAVPLLTLQEAERAALVADPQISAALAQGRAASGQARAAAELSNPRLSMGLFNVPLDNLDIRQEPTTQLRLGLHQQLDRGESREIRQQQFNLQSNAYTARADHRARIVLRDLRLVWLELYYQLQAGKTIDETRQLFSDLLQITESQYETGKADQQDVFSAQLELGMLADRKASIQRREQAARTNLGYWLDERSDLPLPDELPALPDPAAGEIIAERLHLHPYVLEQSALMEAREQGVELARQQSRPQWTVGAEYRKRFGDMPGGGDRSDMFALIASVDLPGFKKTRLTAELTAATEEASAAAYTRVERLNRLRSALATEERERSGLESQIELYATQLIPDASANQAAALRAYQSGVGDFSALIRAQSAELDLRLQLLRLKVDLAANRARILYLDPDATPRFDPDRSLATQTGAPS